MTTEGTAATDGSADTADSASGPPAPPGSARPEPAASTAEIPFGAWPSPISAADVARAGRGLSFPVVIGPDTWWQERRPEENGRTTIVWQGQAGEPTVLLPAPWNARTRVHEYGGQAYLPLPAGPGGGRALVFANYSDQRLYLAGAEVAGGRAEPEPLTPDPVTVAAGTGTMAACSLRFADLVLSPDEREVWCVHERHDGDKITRSIAAVPLDGSAATEPEAIRTLVTGSDFFAFPTPAPDGGALAWISWNHPHMPWDGTELRVAPLENGVPGRSRLLQGSIRESVLAPLWRDSSTLYAATDWTGWWNVYQLGLGGEPPRALYPADEEFAGPLWVLGARPFALLGDGRLAVVHGQGGGSLGLLDPESFELTPLDVPFEHFEYQLSADGATIAGIAAGPLQPRSVVRVDVATGKTEVLRRGLEDLPDPGYLPVPRPVDLEGVYGRVVHALVYPPSHPAARGPAGARPPYVVWVHGGPTSHASGLLDLEKAYFTSRGIGVIDVNYGGSSGYGRSYRERLRRQWGVVDVEDATSAARSLADSGEADPARLAIRGGSAGGWTALAAVTSGLRAHRGRIRPEPVFSAVTSLYGVSDLRRLAEDSHDFESRYLDGLVGPLPGFDTVYAERAPVGNVTDATSPVLLLQGLDDPVVPPSQSESIAADLAAHGIRHAYLTFEGESHGFRKLETMTAALEAELSFYGQIFGFAPPGVPDIKITEAE